MLQGTDLAIGITAIYQMSGGMGQTQPLRQDQQQRQGNDEFSVTLVHYSCLYGLYMLYYNITFNISIISEDKMSNNRVLMPFKENGHQHQHCLEAALLAAEKTCLERGVRLTSIRRRVLELVWRSHEPVKAYDILDKLRDEHYGSAPPTVYRALDFLQAKGLVHKIESLNAYVGCAEPDHRYQTQFLICHDCGAVAELDNVNIRRLLAENAKQLGFRIEHETIEIKGICSACAIENQ